VEGTVKVKEIIKAVGITVVTMIIINNGTKYLPASVQKIIKGA
jgi:FMN-dependent NADH-azoreductase